MDGQQLRTRTGRVKAVGLRRISRMVLLTRGVKRARPARWMVQAGLANEEEQPKEVRQWRLGKNKEALTIMLNAY